MNKFIKCVCVLTAAFSVCGITKNRVFAETAGVKSQTSKSSYLTDVNSGTVITARNENERLKIASMTKIMLLDLCFEAIDNNSLDLNEDVIISENASGMGGSQVFLEQNGSYKVKELLKSVIISSANDSSVALAERLYGSENECVNAMNEKAKNLGLENTLFSNCTGLPKPMQYSSAKDIAIIFKDLISHEKYFEYSTVWLDEIKHENGRTELANTNKLVRFYDGCDGGKTGFTKEAGFCLTATAKRGNMRLISVVIGSDTSKNRFKEVSDMFNYGFNNYSNKVVVDADINDDTTVKVKGGVIQNVEVKPENNFFVFAKRNSTDDIEIEKKYFSLTAPVKKGDVAGEIVIYLNGVENGKVNLVAVSDVKRMNYFDYLKEIAENLA